MKKLSGVLVCLLLFTFISSARIIEVADAGITDKLKAVIAARNTGGETAYTKYITENTDDFNSIDYSVENGAGNIITGSTDTYIKMNAQSTNYATDVSIKPTFYGSDDETIGLIKFPTATIPATATVTSVTLGLYCEGTNGASTFKVTRLLQSWTDSLATWSWHSGELNDWNTAGALGSGTDIAATSSSTGNAMTDNTWTTITDTSGQLFTDVQNWIDGTYTNNGWALRRDNGSNDSVWADLGSEDHTDTLRPYLKIEYTN